MAKGGKQKRTEADEAGNRRGPGRPPLPEEESRRRRNEHSKKSRANKKFERERFEAFVMQPENIDKYEAFKEDYNKRNGESSKKDGTNKSFDVEMLTASSNVASNYEGEFQSSFTWTKPLTAGVMNSTGIGTPSEPLFPVGDFRSSKFMASASQTAHQSDLAWPKSQKFLQQAQKQHDTCVAKRPSSHGFDQMELQHQMSEMPLQVEVQRSVVAILAQYGLSLQTSAPIVSPAVPHHDPLSRQGTNAAAGSSGGPTTQSSTHNGEVLTLP
ncbi:hypothetical protein SLEP1_g53050 [Rubroshorea leprosula]|uniref:Uncharacterized protein n=1 Tax=Rubroshorea leprosula TaxID=152421 RepID=A0AAV5M9Z2_9ROSI|nr:hypothetical protein SLEP1_g53050 [Rubroshorea leprosula]